MACVLVIHWTVMSIGSHIPYRVSRSYINLPRVRGQFLRRSVPVVVATVTVRTDLPGIRESDSMHPLSQLLGFPSTDQRPH